MSTTSPMSTADRAAMIVGGACIVLGTVVLGTLETIIGNPSPVPVTNEAGEVLATTTFPVEVRAGLVMLGLVVWLVYGLYRLVGPMGPAAGADVGTEPATE